MRVKIKLEETQHQQYLKAHNDVAKIFEKT